MKKLLSILLAVIMLVSFAACGKEKVRTATTVMAGEVGEGKTSFSFTVVDVDGNEKEYTVRTDKTIVGDALVDAGLISGEEGVYGLYVKTVDGTTLDYNKDGKYWAFYVNNELSPVGVDQVNVEKGKTYTFKAIKAE